MDISVIRTLSFNRCTNYPNCVAAVRSTHRVSYTSTGHSNVSTVPYGRSVVHDKLEVVPLLVLTHCTSALDAVSENGFNRSHRRAQAPALGPVTDHNAEQVRLADQQLRLRVVRTNNLPALCHKLVLRASVDPGSGRGRRWLGRVGAPQQAAKHPTRPPFSQRRAGSMGGIHGETHA